MKIAPTLLAAAIALVLVACDGKRDDRTADTSTGSAAASSTAPASTAPAGTAPASTAPAGTASATTANSNSTAAATTAGNSSTATHGSTTPHATLPEADHKALAKVADIDRHEIKAARHVLDKKNMKPEIRSFAETLLADSTRNLAETEQLLGTSGTEGGKDRGSTSSSKSTTASTTAGTTSATTGSSAGSNDDDAEHGRFRERMDADFRRLDARTDDVYAKAWVDHVIHTQEEALKRLDRDIPKATGAAVKAQLEQTRTMIANHLEMARALKAKHG